MLFKGKKKIQKKNNIYKKQHQLVHILVRSTTSFRLSEMRCHYFRSDFLLVFYYLTHWWIINIIMQLGFIIYSLITQKMTMISFFPLLRLMNFVQLMASMLVIFTRAVMILFSVNKPHVSSSSSYTTAS